MTTKTMRTCKRTKHAEDAKRFAARTAHLRDSLNRPFADVAAELTIARHADPLRSVLTPPACGVGEPDRT